MKKSANKKVSGLTDQRKVIAKILSESKEVYGSKDHPDVDELHKRVSTLDDKISIATVYRTVKLFEEAGILVKHDFKAGKARYEINDDHNHLIDINSGEIVEFVDKDIEELQKKNCKKTRIQFSGPQTWTLRFENQKVIWKKKFS